MSKFKSLLIVVISATPFLLSSTAASSSTPNSATWFNEASNLRTKSPTSTANLIQLFRDESVAAQELSKLFSTGGAFADRFHQALEADDRLNDHGDALAIFLKQIPAAEIQKFEVLKYIKMYPQSIGLFGVSYSGEVEQANFEVRETYTIIKASTDLAAKQITFPLETRNLPTICTANYNPQWQDATTSACNDLVDDSIALYRRYTEEALKESVKTNARSILAQISSIRANKKYFAARAEVLKKAKAKLEAFLN